MGMKNDDSMAVPLCWDCHAELHDRAGDEEWFFHERGIDPLQAASDLWALHEAEASEDDYRTAVFKMLFNRRSRQAGR